MNIRDLQNTPLEELTFSVVDTETTGMYAEHNRVMDVGLVKVKNGKIVEKWETLIDPEQDIPYWITKFTNLANEDVVGQPLFKDIAHEFHQKIENTIFVAHNAGFDYGFIYNELSRANITWKSHKLCTVLLGRKLLPELQYANLDVLTQYYNIKISARHRALPDAEATAEVLINLMQIAKERYAVTNFFELEKLQNLKIANKENIQITQTGGLF